MKKLINDPVRFVDEMLAGILAAHPDQLKNPGKDVRVLVRAESPIQGKVGIVTGGGSGHLPVFLGYVGEGLLDGVAVGDVFQSPSAEQILEATRGVHGGAGVLYLYGNYMGDVMNFDMAGELAAAEGIRVETVKVADDVASAPRAEWEKRRGVAGLFYAYKAAGAMARRKASLDEVKRVAEKAVERTATMGVALTPCTVPAVGRPSFSIGDNEMEIGMGIHGEKGIWRIPLEPADRVMERMLEPVIADLSLTSGDRVSVLVNGLGATPKEELYILYRKAHEMLTTRGIRVGRVYVGEFATSLEMAGASITLLKLDDELASLIAEAARTPFFVQA